MHTAKTHLSRSIAPVLRTCLTVLSSLSLVAGALVATPLGTTPLAAQESALARGVRAFEARRYEEARPALLAAAKADGRDATAPLYLGRLAIMSGDANGAVRWLEHATARAPKNGEAHRWLGRAYARQTRRAGRLKQAMLAGKVRSAFERAVALDPKDVESRRDLLQFYLVAPRVVGGGVDKAEAQARELTRHSRLYGQLAGGWIAEARDDHVAAQGAYESAIAAWADSAAPYLSLGALQQRRKQWPQAMATYERLIQKRPAASEALYQLGRAAALSGTNLARGAAALEQFIARQPGEEEAPLASAHVRLGAIRERQGDKASARRHYQAALTLDKGFEDARKALARVK